MPSSSSSSKKHGWEYQPMEVTAAGAVPALDQLLSDQFGRGRARTCSIGSKSSKASSSDESEGSEDDDDDDTHVPPLLKPGQKVVEDSDEGSTPPPKKKKARSVPKPKSPKEKEREKKKSKNKRKRSDRANAPDEEDNVRLAPPHERRVHSRATPKDDVDIKALHARQLAIIASSQSEWYQYFETPMYSWVNSAKAPGWKHSFKCRCCRQAITRPIQSTSTTCIKTHRQTCLKSHQQTKLADVGVQGTGDSPNVLEVRQTIALMCAQNAAPFNIVEWTQFRKLFTQTHLKRFPSRTTIPEDIKILTDLMRPEIIRMLSSAPVAKHLGVDLSSMPGGMGDMLGIVIYWASESDGETKMESLVLEYFDFPYSHTGKNMSKLILEIVKRYEFQAQLFSIVADNAASNDVMIRLLGYDSDTPLFQGENSQSRCGAHVLNLVAQIILLVFKKKKLTIEEIAAAAQIVDELADYAEDDSGNEDDVEAKPSFPKDLDVLRRSSTAAADEAFDAGSRAVDGDDNAVGGDELIALRALQDGNLSAEPTISDEHVGSLVWKVAHLAIRVHYSTGGQALFEHLAKLRGLVGPFRIPLDVITRWNSTCDMLEATLRLWKGVKSFQRHEQHKKHFPPGVALTDQDEKILQSLLALLRPLQLATKALSRKGVPLITHVIKIFDQLEEAYHQLVAREDAEDFKKDACRRALTLIDKYQKKFHESDVYRVAILVHPSLGRQYFKAMGYTDDFIQQTIKIARQFWVKHYKKDGGGAPLAPTSSGSSISSILGSGSRLERARAAARSNDPKPQDKFSLWLDRPTEVAEFELVDELCPVGYWGTERREGRDRDGFTAMALDFSSVPATGVDVEQAFSVSSHLMSKRRHRLNNSTAAAACTLGRWSNAGLVPDGLLASVLRRGRTPLVVDLVSSGEA